MIAANALPNRRVEGWRWSDLSAALAGRDLPIIPGDRHVLARLAIGARRMAGIVVNTGETRTEIERVGGEGVDTRALEIDVRDGASMSLVTIQQEGDVALAHRKVRLGQGATFRQFVVAGGAQYARIETEIEVAGSGAKVELNGVYLVAKGRHADLTSQVIMQADHAEVRQIVRGAARKGGRGVFQGRFKVERAAQKADAKMEHNALLLEDGAEVFAKPELEIYADDVQCAHGNTSGQLDEAAIFYLRQRGLPEIEARAMITRAFLIEALPDWLDEAIHAEVEARIDAWLGAVS
ncbi:MAG TPA: SufD family Fe-S cluster assembly protein [Hyphomonadaceae bacterium]|nr:SufD family Fe-S cluster assembly protein [Hyphomonadaceae bacterium]